MHTLLHIYSNKGYVFAVEERKLAGEDFTSLQTSKNLVVEGPHSLGEDVGIKPIRDETSHSRLQGPSLQSPKAMAGPHVLLGPISLCKNPPSPIFPLSYCSIVFYANIVMHQINALKN